MEEKELTFEEKLQRVTEIADALSSSSVSLQDSLKLYEEGRTLINEMNGELDDVKARVAVLTSQGTTEDFE